MRPVVYLSVEGVLEIHRRVIEVFGGDHGVRDRGLLASAVAMPRASFGGEELHVGLAEKAAAYHFHLCANHPFVDGNKRVAVVAAEVFLEINGCHLGADDKEVERLTRGVASGQLTKGHVIDFFSEYVQEE